MQKEVEGGKGPARVGPDRHPSFGLGVELGVVAERHSIGGRNRAVAHPLLVQLVQRVTLPEIELRGVDVEVDSDVPHWGKKTPSDKKKKRRDGTLRNTYEREACDTWSREAKLSKGGFDGKKGRLSTPGSGSWGEETSPLAGSKR